MVTSACEFWVGIAQIIAREMKIILGINIVFLLERKLMYTNINKDKTSKFVK
jgi:hypothetical protein